MKKKLFILLLLCAGLTTRADTVSFRWDAQADATTFRLYSGSASGLYDNVQRVTGTSATVFDIPPNTYFALSAVGDAGIESELSTEVVYAGRAVVLVGRQDGAEVFRQTIHVSRDDTKNFFRVQGNWIQRTESLLLPWKNVALVVLGPQPVTLELIL